MEIAIVVVIAAVAGAAVLYPLLATGRSAGGERMSEPVLNEQVARYREAIRQGTLCDRCLAANSAGSRYCADCGSSLVG